MAPQPSKKGKKVSPSRKPGRGWRNRKEAKRSRKNPYLTVGGLGEKKNGRNRGVASPGTGWEEDKTNDEWTREGAWEKG